MGWATKLMEAKGIAFNDAWHVGLAKTVVLNNPNKDNLKYEASLSCSPTNKAYVSNKIDKHLPPDKTGVVDSGATHMYIAPNAPYEKVDTTEKNKSRHRKWTSSKLHSHGHTLHPTIECRLPQKRLHYAYLHKHTHWSATYFWCKLHSSV